MQAQKAGILEIGDILVVNKADLVVTANSEILSALIHRDISPVKAYMSATA